MAYQNENNSKWGTAFKEGLVWACIAFIGSWGVFFVVLCLFGRETLRILFAPSIAISDYLILKDILSNENMLGSVLIALVVPWMIIGFIAGALRGFFFRPSAMSEKDGCLKASFYVVLAVLIGVALIFIY